MVRLVTMEAKTENHHYCEIFFNKINEMLEEFSSSAAFNPVNIQCDEHSSAKVGLKSVYGDEFVELRTTGCDFHLQKSIDKHKKYFTEQDGTKYNMVFNALKNSVTADGYIREKLKLESLIASQPENCQLPLTNMLVFWDKVRFRWATAFKNNLHNTPRSSLAEASQASMTAGGEKNISLSDSACSHITECIRLEATWLNRQAGERVVGTGPSALELEQRNERRQMARTNRFLTEIAETEEREEHASNDNGVSNDQLQSSQPPKAKRRRLKSLETKQFQAILKKAEDLKSKIWIVEMQKSEAKIKITIQQSKTLRIIEISEELECTCSSMQMATRKTCHHIVWLFLNLFNVQKNDQLLAQVEIGVAKFNQLAQCLPVTIPDHLSRPAEIQRDYAQQLKDHRSFMKEQVWYLSRKRSPNPSRCSGCLQPRKIVSGDLHFYVEGLLFLEKDNKVVETKLRFCLKSNCVRNITSTLNNIRSMLINTKILQDSSLEGISEVELKRIKDDSFSVEGIDTIPILQMM